MRIPDSCKTVALFLAKGKKGESAVLRHLRLEKCVDADTTEEYFRRLSTKGDPRSLKEAESFCQDIVSGDPERFLWRGRQIPTTLFRYIFRLEDVKSLRYGIPDCLGRFGIRDEDLVSGLSEDELAAITDEYDDYVELGNHQGTVWVTDHDVVEDEKDLKTLVDRLGLTNLQEEDYCIICVYSRSDVPSSLHVPRCFDGFGNRGFELVEDCEADSGKTKPLTLSLEPGLPEAVHRKCRLIPQRWDLGHIE